MIITILDLTSQPSLWFPEPWSQILNHIATKTKTVWFTLHPSIKFHWNPTITCWDKVSALSPNSKESSTMIQYQQKTCFSAQVKPHLC